MTALFELAARLQSANAAEGMLWMVVKATLVLAIARLLLLALPRASAAVKHAIATVALVGVAAMPVFSVVIPAWELSVARNELRAPARQELWGRGWFGQKWDSATRRGTTALSVAGRSGCGEVDESTSYCFPQAMVCPVIRRFAHPTARKVLILGRT